MKRPYTPVRLLSVTLLFFFAKLVKLPTIFGLRNQDNLSADFHQIGPGDNISTCIASRWKIFLSSASKTYEYFVFSLFPLPPCAFLLIFQFHAALNAALIF